MILNFTQWERLRKNIFISKKWFEKNRLLKGYIQTLDKIADSTLHELSQIRGWDDWDIFLKDIPEENRLPLKVVVNFVNYTCGIEWPYSKRDEFIKEFKDFMKEDKSWSKMWVTHHDLFMDYYLKTFIHYNPDDHGGLVYISTNRCDVNHKNTSKVNWGLVVSDNEYVPISVEF